MSTIQTIIIICCTLVMLGYSKQLVMIQETFRHGARQPLFIQQSRHCNYTINDISIGQLTNQGKHMHYKLGQIIYQKYWKGLFGNNSLYYSNDIYVKSTNVNRTLQSAQSHLYGLLQKIQKLQLTKQNYQYSTPAWKNTQFNQNITDIWEIYDNNSTFHPLAIHTQKKGASSCDDGDFLTKYQQDSCPNQVYWVRQNTNSDGYLQITRDQRIKDTIKALSDQVGSKVQFWDVFKWSDVYTCLKYLGKPTLKVFQDPKYASNLNFIDVYTMYMLHFSQKQQIRTVSTPYFQQTLQNLQNKINQISSPKIIIYSAHDTTIGMILASMNMVNVQCLIDHYLKGMKNDDICIWQYPPYSANIIFQLWKNGTQYTIRVLYNGQIRKIPICNNKTQCTLHEFKQWYNNFKVQNIDIACGFITKNKIYYAIIFVMGSFLIGFLLYICFLKRRVKQLDTVGRAKKEGYDQNFEQKIEQMRQNKHI